MNYLREGDCALVPNFVGTKGKRSKFGVGPDQMCESAPVNIRLGFPGSVTIDTDKCKNIQDRLEKQVIPRVTVQIQSCHGGRG